MKGNRPCIFVRIACKWSVCLLNQGQVRHQSPGEISSAMITTMQLPILWRPTSSLMYETCRWIFNVLLLRER